MFDAAKSFFEALLVNVRAADLLDVAIIGALVYGMLAWLSQRVSRVVGFGLVSIGALYGAAQVFDLYLTSMVFHVGLTVIAVAFVIVFQDDIRRLFERVRTLTTWGSTDRGGGAGPDLEELVEAMGKLAAERVGALVVLRGRESIDVHLHGGIKADARISVPLLESIFHPKTAGHDGAVVVSGDKIERFAVHLPLSTNLSQVGPGGTRHAAALGLSERCDALVIVVSEERGTISVVQEGRLEVVDSVEALRERVDRFYRRGVFKARKPRWRRMLTHNAGLKVSSVGLAFLLWVGFAYQIEPVQRTFEVPVEYRGLADNWYIEDPKPMKVRVDLSGSERAFRSIEPSQLKISVDLGEARSGPQQFTLSEQHLNEPAGVSVSGIEPRNLRLRAHKLVDKELPVKAELSGQLPDGYELEQVSVEPGRVAAKVPGYLSAYVTELSTETIRLDKFRADRVIETSLALPQHTRVNGQTPPKIKVRLQIRKTPPAQPSAGSGS